MTYEFLLRRAIFLAHKVLMREICDAARETDPYRNHFQAVLSYIDEYLGLVALVPAFAAAHRAATTALPLALANLSMTYLTCAEYTNLAMLVVNPLQDVVQQHYSSQPRRPGDWKCKTAPDDPTYGEWQPEDFTDITHEELTLLIDDIVDNCLAGSDEIAKLVMGLRSYLQTEEAA